MTGGIGGVGGPEFPEKEIYIDENFTGDFELRLIPEGRDAPSFEETANKIQKLFQKIKDFIWAIPREVIKFTAAILRLVSDAGKEIVATASHVHRTISGLGVASFVTMLLNFLHIPFKVKEAVDKDKIGDTEGAVRASFDVVGFAAETVHDMSLGVAALIALGAVPFIAAFTLIVVPLAIVVLTYATAKGIYDIVRQGQFLYSIPKSSENLKEFLDEKLGTQINSNNEITFSAKHISVLTRRSDKKIVKIMKKLRENLGNDQIDTEEALQHMKKFMWRKIGIESVGVVANTALLAALIASLALPGLTAIALPAAGATKAGLVVARLGLNTALYRWNKNNRPKFQAMSI